MFILCLSFAIVIPEPLSRMKLELLGKLDDEVNRIGIFVGIEKMCDKSVEGNKDFRNSHTAAPLCDLIGIDNRGRAHKRRVNSNKFSLLRSWANDDI